MQIKSIRAVLIISVFGIMVGCGSDEPSLVDRTGFETSEEEMQKFEASEEAAEADMEKDLKDFGY